jgi:hypothetical protein
MAGWSKLTQIELRTLLRSRGQPVDGSKAALVQRLTAFLSHDREATGDGDVGEGDGASASETARLEAAELQVIRTETVAATARGVLHQHRVRHNEQSCALLQLVAHDDLRPTFMRAEVWGVVGLWRLWGVCRAFRGWARAELSSLPRVVAVCGGVGDSSAAPKLVATSSVESLDLSTMRWSAAGCMSSLPDPRAYHSVSCRADGRVVVCSGWNVGGADTMLRLRGTALQWLPGTGAWSALPDLPAKRHGMGSVSLPDGRTMLIGGQSGGQALASVVVLAADGSGWSNLAPLTRARHYPAAALLPDGKVLVAGGMSGTRSANTAFHTINTAELWDPATQKWTALPSMVHKRAIPVACVLPSGRVAVVGGQNADGAAHKDGEVFDPVKREWEPLGAETASMHGDPSAVAVSGGLVIVSEDATDRNELYDEESGRWFALPHAMVQSRQAAGLVSVPVAALTLQ